MKTSIKYIVKYVSRDPTLCNKQLHDEFQDVHHAISFFRRMKHHRYTGLEFHMEKNVSMQIPFDINDIGDVEFSTNWPEDEDERNEVLFMMGRFVDAIKTEVVDEND